jgi:hypothetical protein
MTEPTIYEIVTRGRANARLMRPLLDDFILADTGDGNTWLTGEVRDAAHLHGVVTHLTSVGVELISITPRPPVSPHTSALDTRGESPAITRHERNHAS